MHNCISKIRDLKLSINTGVNQQKLIDQASSILIEKYSSMWINKQVWEFEHTHKNLKFDILFVEPKNNQIDQNSKLVHPKCEINLEFRIDGECMEKLGNKYLPGNDDLDSINTK